MTTFNLTATFSPPPNCLTDVYRYNANQLVGPMASSCYPQGWTNTSTLFYSPGICPSSYTTACITAKTANTVTETIATCCPTSFECAATDNLLGCHSTIVGGQSQLITVVKTDDFSSVLTTRTEVIGGYMNAYGVQIRFQATDLQRITATTSTAASTSSPGAATFATTIPQPNAAQTQTPPPRHALSAGAKAGIGVGAAIAVCVGLVLIWLGWRCTKRRSVPSAQVAQNEGKKDGESQEIDREVWFPEMQGAALFEAPGNNLHQEVEGHPIAHLHELEGRRR